MTHEQDSNPICMPPWGVQTTDDLAAMETNFGVPPHWKIGKSLGRAELRNSWNAFIVSTLQLLNDTLWPVFDFQQMDWPVGTQGHREMITRADLEIMTAMNREAPKRLVQQIRTKVSSPAAATHFKRYQEEDDSVLGRNYAEYDTTLSPALLADVPLQISAGLDNKSASTAKQLKKFLQRPRAYQMALPFKTTAFEHQDAVTAHSPSMISGHGLAGTIGVGAVIDYWLGKGVKLSEESWEAIEQLAVDMGDRRVFAGVHYPADNLSSWIVTMLLGRQVFEHPETLRHLWLAVTKRSYVFQKIVEHPSYAYKAALEEFYKLEPSTRL